MIGVHAGNGRNGEGYGRGVQGIYGVHLGVHENIRQIKLRGIRYLTWFHTKIHRHPYMFYTTIENPSTPP